MISWAKKFGLVIFTWGEMNNNKETIDELKRLGVDAVIFDRCTPLTLTRTYRHSIFRDYNYIFILFLFNLFAQLCN